MNILPFVLHYQSDDFIKKEFSFFSMAEMGQFSHLFGASDAPQSTAVITETPANCTGDDFLRHCETGCAHSFSQPVVIVCGMVWAFYNFGNILCVCECLRKSGLN